MAFCMCGAGGSVALALREREFASFFGNWCWFAELLYLLVRGMKPRSDDTAETIATLEWQP